MFEITFGIYFLLVFSTLFAELEQNLLLSFVQAIITSFFVLKNIYVYQQAEKADS